VESADREDFALCAYNMRLTPELCEFLRRCLQLAIANLVQKPGRGRDVRLKAIADDVVIKDSSVVRLLASLAWRFPPQPISQGRGRAEGEPPEFGLRQRTEERGPGEGADRGHQDPSVGYLVGRYIIER
ncbi:transposase, partial [mine drainage metagenome]